MGDFSKSVLKREYKLVIEDALLSWVEAFLLKHAKYMETGSSNKNQNGIISA